MGVRFWFLMAVGCGRIGFESPAAGSLDATPVDSVPLGPFGTATVIPTLQGSYDLDDPGISPDGLELYVASKVSGNEDIYVSRRNAVSDPWPAPVVVPGMDTVALERSPELTADGLTMYYASGVEIFVATRPTTAAAWTIAATGVTGMSVGTPAVCDSGLTMYLRRGLTGTEDLFVATRATVSDAWSQPVLVPELSSSAMDSGPWVTPDCGRIYFDSDRTINGVPYVAERMTDGSFSAPVELVGLREQVGSVHDLSLTTDERYVVFSHNGTGFSEIWEASR